MSSLALALYIADKIEPDREGDGVEDLRRLATEDLRRAATASLEASISYNESRGNPTHPQSRRALEWLKDSEQKVTGEPEV